MNLSVASIVAEALKENPVLNVLKEDEMQGWKELHQVSPQKDLAFEDFMNKKNYFMKEGK